MEQEKQLRNALKRAVRRRDQARAAEHDAIVAALRGGVRQVDIVQDTGYSREHLRRLAREEGIPLRREPTVVSKKAVAQRPAAD